MKRSLIALLVWGPMAAICPTMSGSLPPQTAAIAVDPAQRFQTINGWEAAVLASIQDWTRQTDAEIAQQLDLVVNDLGFTRVRLAIRAGTEGGDPKSFSPVNDNRSAGELNAAAFNWSILDAQMDRLVMPLRKLAAARGLPFYINLQYVDHTADTRFEHRGNEYAEFMFAVFQHLQEKYRVVPNAIEIVNEPDNFADWGRDDPRIGDAIAATASRLKAAGWTPDFIAPSTTSMPNASRYLDTILRNSGARAALTEVAYHRYNMDGDLAALAERAAGLGKRTSMLEAWGHGPPESAASARMLHEDLKVGRVSAWQQGPPVAHGCRWGPIVGLENGKAVLCRNTHAIRQYTKHVLPGAVRIGASSTSATVDPLAFRNADGKLTVVAETTAGANASISGLPAGTYGRYYTIEAATTDLPDVTITQGQPVTLQTPEPGYFTVFAKAAAPPPSL
jgi:O-glycosyl hydrolase